MPSGMINLEGRFQREVAMSVVFTSTVYDDATPVWDPLESSGESSCRTLQYPWDLVGINTLGRLDKQTQDR